VEFGEGEGKIPIEGISEKVETELLEKEKK